MRANLTEAGAGYEPIPAGRYNARITDGEVKEAGPNAKNPGAEYIHFEFTLTDGEYEGRKVWTNAMLTGKGTFRINEILKCTDIDLSNPEDVDFDIEDDIIGTECRIRVKVKPETDEYDASNEVTKVMPLGEGDADSSVLP